MNIKGCRLFPLFCQTEGGKVWVLAVLPLGWHGGVPRTHPSLGRTCKQLLWSCWPESRPQLVLGSKMDTTGFSLRLLVGRSGHCSQLASSISEAQGTALRADPIKAAALSWCSTK